MWSSHCLPTKAYLVKTGYVKILAVCIVISLVFFFVYSGVNGQKTNERKIVAPPVGGIHSESSVALVESSKSPEFAVPVELPASSSESNHDSSKNGNLMRRAMRYGYSQFIDSAIDSRDPQKSFEAANILEACRTIERRIARSRKYANSQTGSGKDNRGVIASLKDDENVQRHCQVITAAHQEQYMSLLEVAALGGTLGAASTYYHELTVVQRKDPSAIPWQLNVLMRDADLGDVTAIKALGCDKIGASLLEKQRQTYRAALRIAAKGGRAEEHASMLVDFCGEHSDSVAVVDTRAVQKLLTAIERVGTDYLENR
jgi:hypothetical protein